ncbi:hypothetical protein BDW62DRAFT_173541 [Aspergillus aurantiobrunneus]
MLKPFLIRDLDDDSQLVFDNSSSDLYNATDVSVGAQRRHRLVQLAAADYDELAYIHPQARLTYLDDDDGEIITVGSSLELSQRLDEPPSQTTDTDFPSTIHIFDINRRKSIADLWKRFECKERIAARESLDAEVAVDDLGNRATTSEPITSHEQRSQVEDEQANTAGNAASDSFLSAFETEMAKVMTESQRLENTSENNNTSSSRTAQPESTSSLPRDTTEAFASALRNLIEVTELISSGVKSKLPELERHLDNARRSLPSDITDSMRNAFSAFEEQVRAMASTINNLPEMIRRENGPGNARLFPEFPISHSAINGLRDMGAQLGGMGQTLLDVFESSVRNALPRQRDGLFSKFPFSEPNNHPTSVPHDVAGNSSSHHNDTTSGSATRSDNPPVSIPFGWHSTAVPDPVQGPSTSRSVPQTYPSQFPSSALSNHPLWGPGHWPCTPAYQLPASLFPPTPAPFPITPSRGASPQTQQARPEMPSWEPPSHESHPSRSLFIGNVGFNVTDRMIKDVFTSKGLQVDVNLPLDSRTSKHAGFGYLTFPSDAEATTGLRELQGAVIDGHCINLEYVDHSPITSLMPQETEASNPATASSPQTSGVVHRDTADDAPVHGDETNPSKEGNETVHDLLLAQTEARFPPVSQLDAHMLAEQSSQTRQPATLGEGWDTTLRGNAGPSHALPGSFPQDPHDAPTFEPSTETQPPHPSYHYRHRHNHPQPHPRRAAIVRLPEPHRRSFDPFEPQPGLRRRATERHSHRGGPHMGPLGPRHRASFHHLSQPDPASAPAQSLSTHEEPVPHPQLTQKAAKKQRKQRAIDECIAALAQIGYGSEVDGGNQRLAVYAAAAGGELADAIEMIEEERKAYEQRE